MKETLRFQPENQIGTKKKWLRQLLTEFEEERDKSSNDGREPLIERAVGVYESLLIIDGSLNGNRQSDVREFRSRLSTEIEFDSRKAGRKIAKVLARAKSLSRNHY